MVIQNATHTTIPVAVSSARGKNRPLLDSERRVGKLFLSAPNFIPRYTEVAKTANNTSEIATFENGRVRNAGTSMKAAEIAMAA